MGIILVLYGPSTAGKSEIQKALIKSNIPKIITVTTRLPRNGEVHGIHYYFMNRHMFKNHIDQEQFIEWTEYNGEYYGTLKSTINEMMSNNSVSHIVMDLKGVLALKKHFPKVFAIYVGVNLESMKRRLIERGSFKNEVKNRLNKAMHEELTDTYRSAANFVIWNNDGIEFHETINHLNNIVNSLINKD